MRAPGEHKTVQSRILGYAEAIGWTIVSRDEAERRRGFHPEAPSADRAKNRSLFFNDLLDDKQTQKPSAALVNGSPYPAAFLRGDSVFQCVRWKAGSRAGHSPTPRRPR